MRAKVGTKSAILEMLIITGLKLTRYFPLLTEMLQFSPLNKQYHVMSFKGKL